MKNCIDIAKKYLESKKLGGFEALCVTEDHFSADSKDLEIESLEEATEVGFAVRVINEHRLGFSYTTSLEDTRVKDCIDMAIASSKNVGADESWALAKPKKLPEFKWKYNDETLSSVPVSKKTELAILLESTALNVDPRIKRVRRAIYEELRVRRHLINSEGIDVTFGKTIIGCDVMPVAEANGDTQWAWDTAFSHRLEGLDVASVGKRAASSAIELLGAKSIQTIKTPVCLDPQVMVQFLKVFCNGFYGDNIFKKKSALVGKLGESLYSKMLNVIDNGILKEGHDSSPFDSEGEARRKIYLVKEGRVNSWLTDTYWGKKLGFPSTGSSTRNSIKELPGIGVSNVYIEGSNSTPEELFKKMSTGLYITEVVGVHTANAITGDFSVGASGHWIERGAKSFPVKGVVVSGNLHDVYKNVVAIANDLDFMGNLGAPTTMISSMQVSGS